MDHMEHGKPYSRIPRKADRRQRRTVRAAQGPEGQLNASRTLLSLDPALICPAKHALYVAPRSVHVWAFELAASQSCIDACRATLCRAEEARADRFVHARGREDFVVAHGVLRHLLGRYTGLAARDLRFSTGPNGKPMLDAPAPQSKVSFNLTHSQGRALIAVSDGREVGIDLEKIKSHVRALAIARRYFASAEWAAVEGAPAPQQARVFFRYWVAKEAVLKGQGIGLRFPIDRFELEFDAGNSSAGLRNCGAPLRELSPDWTIQMLPLEADWVGALAVRGTDWTLRLENQADAPRSPTPQLAKPLSS